MDSSSAQVQTPVEFIQVPPTHQNSSKKYIFIGGCFLILLGLLLGIYTLFSQWQEQERLRLAALEEQRIYNSIPTEFAHYYYEDATRSAQIQGLTYPKKKLERLKLDGDFKLKIKTIIPKEHTRDIHLEWEKVPEIKKYSIQKRNIAGGYSEYPEIQTADNYTIITVSNYIDYAFIVYDECLAYCPSSNEVYLQQVQKMSFKLSAEARGSMAKLSWEAVPNTIKYNIYSKSSPFDHYKLAMESTKNTSVEGSLIANGDTYFIVQACNLETCVTSNEVMVEKE